MTALKGMHRWVTWPSTLSGLLGTLLAIFYAASAVVLVPGTEGRLTLIVGAVVALFSWLGDRREQQSLAGLRALGKGELPATPANLTQALREVAALPDAAFWINAICFALGAVAVSLLYATLPEVTLRSTWRVAFTGLVLAPLVAVLSHLTVLGRARRVMSIIVGGGLSAADVLGALSTERAQLKRRLVVFTGTAVLTPLALIIDLSLAGLQAQLSRLLSAAPQEQAALAEGGAGLGLYGTVIALLVLVGVVLACAFIGGRVLGEPLSALAAATQRMARGQSGHGQLVLCEDEAWGVAAALSGLEAQLLGAVQRLKEAGVKIAETTRELISSSTKHEAGASEQTGALTQTSATTEELARSARQIAQNASEVTHLAQQLLESAQQGKRTASAFYNAVLRVREGNQAVADSVVRLNKRVQQIGRIVEFIDGIADKSDLLALNAELEGTKAGAVGRGFSLVAAEMRRLAESVMSSTKEITRLISEIRDATNAAVMATEAGVKATDAGSALARAVSESLDRIVDFANQTTDAVKSITHATHQQQTGTDQLATAMADILRSTQGAQRATAQMSSANADLAALSNELQSSVQTFEASQ